MSIVPNGRAIRGFVLGGPLCETHGRQFMDELRTTASAYGVCEGVGFIKVSGSDALA